MTEDINNSVSLKDMGYGHDLVGKSVLVTDRKQDTTKKGDPYLRLKIRDQSAEIPAIAWGYDPSADGPHHEFDAGQVIQVWGTLDSYNDGPQLKITHTAASPKSVMDFAKQTRFDVDKLWGELVELVGGFNEPMTKWVTEELLMRNAVVIDAYKKAPAARGVHNAWFGGLLEHVWSLCSIAQPLIEHYRSKYYKGFSRDKVLFGLIMHDAGKIVEYDYSTPAFNFTGLGLLANHMVLGPAWVYEKCNEWWRVEENQQTMPSGKFKAERAHLMHILAAHHGQIEWGSPMKPASLEAVLVHHLDNLDSKFMHALEHVEGPQGPIKGFSEKSYIERGHFYQYGDL